MRPGPGLSIPIDGDLAAVHICSQMHTGLTLDGDSSRAHSFTDALHVAQITFDEYVLCAIPLDRKQVTDGYLPASQEQRERSHLLLAESGEPVGADVFRFDRQGDRISQS
jgi:hypothetical protein